MAHKRHLCYLPVHELNGCERVCNPRSTVTAPLMTADNAQENQAKMMEEALKTKYAYSFDFSCDKGPAASSIAKPSDRIFADRSPDPRIFDVHKLELNSHAPQRPARCFLVVEGLRVQVRADP